MKKIRPVLFLLLTISLFLSFIIFSISGCGGGGTTESNPSLRQFTGDVVTFEKSEESILSQGEYEIIFTPGSDWGSGYTASITVRNLSDRRINDWQFDFNFDYGIDSIWSGKLVKTEGNSYSVGGESWNSYIEPGGSVTFGFQGSPGNLTGEQPYNCVLSGEQPLPPSGGGGDAETGEALVTFSVDSDWGSGFSGKVEIENKSSFELNNWNLEFDFDHEINSIWNADKASHTGSRYLITPKSWNGTIPVGGKFSFGFTGSPGNVSEGIRNVDFWADGFVPPEPTPTPSPSPTTTPDPLPTISPSPEPSASPSPTPSPTVTPTPPSGDKRVVAYFVQWGIYARGYEVPDIPANKVTHINYAFASINSTTGTLELYDSWADVEKVFTGDEALGFSDQTWDESARGEAGNFGRLRQLKEIYPHVKTMLSVGGWTLSYKFPPVAATAQAREKFASSCVEMISKYGFDGIDIDWEYPTAAEKENYTLLLAELRKQLDAQGSVDGKTYLLSVATPAGSDKLVNLELDKIADCVDFINIMTYDLHGGWETTTNHHSPLESNPSDPINVVDRERLNVTWVVDYYVNAGVPPEKLNIGVPFYGRAWEEVPDLNNGLFQSGGSLPNTGVAGNWEAGMLDYWKILELQSTGGYTRYMDNFAKVPWLYGVNLSSFKTTGGMFVTYEDTESLRGKIDFLKEKGLGGVMIWELSGDVRDSDSSDSLLKTISDNLKD